MEDDERMCLMINWYAMLLVGRQAVLNQLDWRLHCRVSVFIADLLCGVTVSWMRLQDVEMILTVVLYTTHCSSCGRNDV